MRLTRISLVCVLLLGTFLFAGCTNPPANTIAVDIDADGLPDLYAFDDDGDGQPDTDANGDIIVAVPLSMVKIARQADSIGPSVLSAVAGFAAPIPWLATILVTGAWLWRETKFGKIFINTVASIQSVRRKLAKDKPDALAIMDDALDSTQVPATVKEIKRIRDKYNMKSVAADPPK